MRDRPTNEGSLILGRSQLDVLEAALADGPNGDDGRGGEDGERVVVLVPLELLDAGRLVAGELSDHLAGSVEHADNPVVTSDSDHVGVRGPRSPYLAVTEVVRRKLEDLFDL